MHNISVVCANENIVISQRDNELMQQVIRCACDAEQPHAEFDVYVMITDNAGIQELNSEHRGKDAPTDVLSFPMQELVPGVEFIPSPLELDPETNTVMLGDIVISLERAIAQAAEYNHSLTRELCFLAAHSALHLLGYDHEKSEADEKLHFARQDEILDKCGISREVE